MHRHVLALDKASFAQALPECRHAKGVRHCRTGPEVADNWPRASLRERGDRPRRRASEQGDELALVHSITSSARASRLSGTVRPSAFAVLRLTTSSSFVDS